MCRGFLFTLQRNTGEKVRFSIIIPSFNSEKYIAQALQSVEDQQYDKVEVILIDGGSTDRTLEIAIVDNRGGRSCF
ncbi:MAG TPA: glycosyltransferase, partial [bacterium]|nr:glycosyltransferase [bacterium]